MMYRTSEPTIVREKRGSSLPAWIGGIIVGMLIAVAFWAGHVYWPGSIPIPLPGTDGKLTDPTARVAPPIGGTASPAQILALAENTIADIAEKASDSTVNIDISSKVTVPEVGMPFGSFDFFFGQMPQQQPRTFQRKGSGSGVVYRSDGYILTNNHVVGDADDIQVTLNKDKKTYKGRVVGRDSFTDLALVKIDANNLPAAAVGTSGNLRPGDWAIAIGSPLGLDHTVTLGIISALGRSLNELNSNVELIQTDAAINPGNSGGPLLNIHGQVIGINTAIRGDAQNIGFAIPIDVAKDVATQLLEKGKISRPYLGIYMQELDEKLSKSLGLPASTKGVVIAKVGDGSPAANAGLQIGDVVDKIDGVTVKTSKEVQTVVRKHKPGDTLNFLIRRDGAMQSISVKIGEYPISREER